MRKKVKELRNRKKLEHEFRKKVKIANKILNRFNEENKRFILDDDYGATFHDKTIVTKKGLFRNNASKLTVKELNSRIEMMKTFIEDSDDYFRDVDLLTEIGTKMRSWESKKEHGNEAIAQDLADFFVFAKAMMGDTFDPSKSSTLQAAEKMLNEGDTLSAIKERFYDAMLNSKDEGTLLDIFAEQGRYL